MLIDSRRLAFAHGMYYLVSGIWPMVHMKTFLLVTGPKTDLWLVKTVGLLLSVIGTVLTVAGLRRRVDSDVSVLAIGAALSVATIDTVYWKRGVLRFVYMLDALSEVSLATAWIIAGRARHREDGTR